MTTSQATNTEIDRYLTAVQARLGDVPEAEEMLEDLRQHLAEVAAEDPGPLEERLGTPAAYADELRTSAGLGAPPGTVATLLGRLPGAGWSRRTRGVAERWRQEPAVASGLELATQLRPAWWVLRGYLLVVGWSAANEPWALHVFPWPRFAGRRTFGVLVTVLVIAGSVWLGRRAERSKGTRMAGIALTVLALIMSAALIGAVRGVAARPVFYPSVEDAGEAWAVEDGALAHPDGRPITNIYPYGPDGEPLEGVMLYDQDGNPLELVLQYGPDGDALVTSYPLDERGRPVTNAFPQHQASRRPAEFGGSEGQRAEPDSDRPEPVVPRLRDRPGDDAPDESDEAESAAVDADGEPDVDGSGTGTEAPAPDPTPGPRETP